MSKQRNTGNLAFDLRNAGKLLTYSNAKTPKGEKLGYLQAILYLSPHTAAGGPTLCSYSTPACREMCLAGAGLSGLPLQLEAKRRRTMHYHEDRKGFLAVLEADISRLTFHAARHGLKPVVRLNGTSDILWERETQHHAAIPFLNIFRNVTFFDYTKVPFEHRQTPAHYKLTYSIGGPGDVERAASYLKAGHGCAVVVPPEAKERLLRFSSGAFPWRYVDGDEHDLRFLDPPGSVALLKPKGRIVTDLVRPDIHGELAWAFRA